MLVGLRHLLADIKEAMAAVVGRRFSIHLKHAILQKALDLEQIDLESGPNQDLLFNANQAATQGIGIQILNSLMLTLRDTVTLAGLMMLLAAVHWALPLMVITASLPTMISGMRYGGARYQILRSQAPRVRVATYLGRLLTTPVEPKEVRTHGLGKYIKRRWRLAGTWRLCG